VVKGPTPLKGREFAIPDLRAGFAYAMAALLSTDESVISNVDYLDRGYEDLVNKLSSLGADISRVPPKKPTDSPKAMVDSLLAVV
jgi:UDP-N-acetylglucosamine 1-carboxyvinyltransferase